MKALIYTDRFNKAVSIAHRLFNSAQLIISSPIPELSKYYAMGILLRRSRQQIRIAKALARKNKYTINLN